MRALLIGGTGIISSAVTHRLAQLPQWEVYVMNRGHRNHELPQGVKSIIADINDEEAVARSIGDLTFDTVCEFIGFEPAQVERDFRLFAGRTRQYIYISSASAYQKPLSNPVITESTPLHNPFWAYSRGKMACEELLTQLYRHHGFPITIVRPSHTYGQGYLPLGIHGNQGGYQVLRRMMAGKPVIVQGDGTSLWTVTHNNDFAHAFVGLMGNAHALGETFHITSDEHLTWNQIYGTVADILGVPFTPYHVSSRFLADVSNFDFEGSLLGDKAHSVIFDNSKIKRLVPDFVATKRFDQGARECIEYLQSHPELQTPDPEFDIWCDRVIETLEMAKRTLSN